MRFADIPGLLPLKEALIQAVRNNHVAHAQLFHSVPGGAGLPIALAYAQYLNCQNPTDNDSCGVCPSCHKYQKLIHPDLHFIYPVASTKTVTKDVVSQTFLKEWRGFMQENTFPLLSDWANYLGTENKQCNISKEESRNIIRTLSLKAFEAPYKVMLVWMPELMHPSAANAILKILEEPPVGTLFLLVSHDASQMLPTILSRTQLVNVPLFHDDEVAQFLVDQFGLTPDHSGQIAYLAEGNLNTALKLQAEIQSISSDFFRDWMRNCFRSDYTQILQFGETFQKMPKEEQKGLLHYALGIFRDAMLWKYAGESLVRLKEDDLEFVKRFATTLTEVSIEGMATHLDRSLYHLERNANPKILFTHLSLQIAGYFQKK